MHCENDDHGRKDEHGLEPGTSIKGDEVVLDNSENAKDKKGQKGK